MKRILTLLICIYSLNGLSQLYDNNMTIGMQYIDEALVSDGYVTFAPLQSNYVFLMNNCGKIIKRWEFSGGFNEACSYIDNNGNVSMLVSSGGGGGAVYGNSCFEVKDWDDNLVWNYCPTGEYVGLHNDLAPLPNGNYLGVVQKTHSLTEAIQAGISPATLGNNNTYLSESVIEFEPDGINGATIVWEWNLFDHLVQDYDSTQANYGVVADHPEKYDINMATATPATGASFTHINSCEYDEDEDLIVVSMFSIHEFFIIDHSTTNDESASGAGGNFGRGGDILYRWGNPQNYGRGTAADQQLSGQHDARLIPSGFANERMISVYNNDSGDDSEILIINPTRDADGNFVADTMGNLNFLPNTPFWQWRENILSFGPPSTLFMSGVAPLENGNMLMCDASSGLLTEVTPAGDIAWVYYIPDVDGNGEGPIQGATGNAADGNAFKVRKYLPDYQGFYGRDLTATLGTIESDNTISFLCSGASIAGENNAALFSANAISNLACLENADANLVVYNFGSSDIVDLEIEYTINGDVNTFSWTGTIASGDSETISLPPTAYIIAANNEMLIEITSVNGGTDDVPTDNTNSFEWENSVEAVFGTFRLQLESDNYTENDNTTIEITDENGAVVYSITNIPENSNIDEPFDLNIFGCYAFAATDSYGDGITGSDIVLLDGAGNTVITVSGNFSSVEENFKVINPAPVVNFDFVTESFNDSTVVTFTDLSSDDAVSWIWDFGDGTFANGQNQTYAYTESGVYDVCLIAFNYTTQDTLCQTVTINVLTSQNEYLGSHVELYPNPVHNVLNIKTESILFETIEIYNLKGKLVKTSTFKSQIEVADLQAGMYYIKLMDVDGNFKVLDFTK